MRAFCDEVYAVEGPAVVVLDGPWGSGKTAFLKMSAACLRSDEFLPRRDVEVVEFNAWHQGFTGEPLVDLAAAVSAELDTERAKEVAGIARKLAWGVVSAAARKATLGLVDPDAIRAGDTAETHRWESAREQTEEFRLKLSKAVPSAGGGRLVVFVDEADRCRPKYALDLLAAARHMFAVDGVIVVFAVNRAELSHSIEALFGEGFNADRYLRRFADTVIRLRSPQPKRMAEFLDRLVDDVGLTERVPQRAQWSCKSMLRLVGVSPGFGLRDAEQAVKLWGMTMSSSNTSEDAGNGNRTGLLAELTAALVVLRTADAVAYERFVYGGGTSAEAAAALSRAMGETPSTLDDTRRLPIARHHIDGLFQAVEAGYHHLEEELWRQGDLPTEAQYIEADGLPQFQPRDFEEEYLLAFESEFGEADEVRRRAKLVTGHSMERAGIPLDTWGSLKDLAARIDMAGEP